MKIEKLVRITAKSECMDIEVVMTDRKATAYVRKLNKIQNQWIESISEKREVKYRPKSYWGPVKTRTVRVVPEGTNQKISIKIEPAGEILN
jgi:hypothetical protein